MQGADFSDRFYRELVEQSLDLITVVDEHGTIVFQTPSVERVLGYAPGDRSGRTMFELIHADDLPRVVAAFKESLATGQPSPVTEYRCKHKDGSWRIFESVGRTVTDLNGDGKITGIIHSRDVTERKRLELQFRHAQKLETIGRMTAAIAHDVNNLLTAILGHANLVLETSVAQPVRGSLMQILAASERAAAFTQQLLGYVRRTDDREETAHDIHDTIADLTRIMDPLLGKMTLLSLALNAQDGRVALDGGSLSQIVMNLVVNARDAMPGGGALAITTRNVTRRSTTQAAAVDYLVLEVSDTGTGMTPDVRARVFEPFFTTKGPNAGTGLGLSTVFDIVRQAEGHIELDTIEGRGTTVRVLLPLARSRGESRCA